MVARWDLRSLTSLWNRAASGSSPSVEREDSTETAGKAKRAEKSRKDENDRAGQVSGARRHRHLAGLRSVVAAVLPDHLATCTWEKDGPRVRAVRAERSLRISRVFLHLHTSSSKSTCIYTPFLASQLVSIHHF